MTAHVHRLINQVRRLYKESAALSEEEYKALTSILKVNTSILLQLQ